jgi:hypothetical protein
MYWNMMNLGLTRKQIRSLDVADVWDIVHEIPGVGVMPQEYGNEYYKLFMQWLEGVDINPWHKLTIKSGINKWKEKAMAELKVTDYVTPDQVVEVFEELRKNMEATYSAQIDLEDAKNALDDAVAKESTNPDFKWGKNETERKAQIRSLFPASAIHIDAVEVQLKKLTQEERLTRLKLDQYRTIISLFEVFNGQKG